jgi:predicted CXXCH cytochrome family protein
VVNAAPTRLLASRPLWTISVLWLLLASILAWSGCERRPAAPSANAQTSLACQECHREQFAAWRETDHARANRPVDPVHDAAVLAGMPDRAAAAQTEAILGHLPLWQPLVATAGGRWQPHELAYDPAKKEWFNVFGSEQRQAGEWGHWTGRGMNWNSMCAQCHMTGFARNYDVASDTYHSTWLEHGIGCVQCHGPTAPGHGAPGTAPARGPQPPFQGDRAKMMQTCAPCHARNEALTDQFRPGDSYHDHYRVVLPVDAATFYPDGQQRDEVFNWTSVLTSRMGHAGVTCLDCHDPHTNKTILPTSDNQLCLQCHAAPGRKLPSGVAAPVIDAVAHSRHQPGSAGNSCVACHMPTTNYMQRAPRHDHGWLSPDPLLTKELGIPNACSRCHEDKGIDWNIAKTAELFGTKVLARQRERARTVAAAQTDAPGAAEKLIALLQREDVPAWRATYLALLAQTADAEKGRPMAIQSLRAADPLERSAAVRFLATAPDAAQLLTPLLRDPVRLVRLDAAWALSPTLAADDPVRQELDRYLALTLDQPAGRLRVGQDKANRGDLVAAEKEMAVAVSWDPRSAGILDAYGMVLAALGRSAEAGARLYRAAELAGDRGGLSAFRAGLAFAEAGRLVEAENSFRLAVRCDPRLARAWYNLGLLLAQNGNATEAITALRTAETTEPAAADYPYALATVLLRTGDLAGARAAAERAVQRDPTRRDAVELLRRLR